MILLIDAYNVLKQMVTPSYITSAQRSGFVRRINNYVTSKHHQAVIVFDGERSEEDFHQIDTLLVRVIYAGYKQSADQVIKRLCNQHVRHEAVVVTTDREIGAYANQLRLACIDADAFFQLLNKSVEMPSVAMVKSVGSATKRAGHESNVDVDQLMSQAAGKIQIKHVDGQVRGSSASGQQQGKKLTKIERRLTALAKKL